MLQIPRNRRTQLTKQHVSQYHVNTSHLITKASVYTKLKYPNTTQTNDACTFDPTDEQQRLRTYNTNWNRDNEGFFSLSPININIQCFSFGVILANFLLTCQVL